MYFNVRYQGFLHIGIPKDIAHSLSLIPFLPALLDIMVLGKKRHNPLAIAHTYFALRSKIGLDWLAIQAAQIHADRLQGRKSGLAGALHIDLQVALISGQRADRQPALHPQVFQPLLHWRRQLRQPCT